MHSVLHESVMGFLADFWNEKAWVSCVNIHEWLGKGHWGMQASLLPGEAQRGGLGADPCSDTNWVNLCDLSLSCAL